jgi:dTDP-4-dehydrorhamnose 3,5-epimerase
LIFTQTPVAGVVILDLELHEDDRGFFARAFCTEEFVAHGLNGHVEQCNLSWNNVRGTLRGLHYQVAPHEETKIVRCTRGAIWDVVVDLRAESQSYRRWTGVELTAENRRALYVPSGVAHGFITTSDDAEVFYMMGSPYAADAARGVPWDDPSFAIRWPLQPVVISDRDRSYPRWSPC